MWLELTLLIVGFVALIWSADKFLAGAAATAANFGVSKMLIGLTVVSIGTSAPEIVVAVMAALEGNPLLAIGNAIGSNIANIGLVLGIAAIITPLSFSQTVRKRELPWLLGATFLAVALMFDKYLGFTDSLILLLGLSYILWRLFKSQQDVEVEDDPIEDELAELPELTRGRGLLWLLIGLAVLLGAAQLLVYAATTIALKLGVSSMIIGLTIVAIGTSLPELAATAGSAMKGYSDIAIGNITWINRFK